MKMTYCDCHSGNYNLEINNVPDYLAIWLYKKRTYKNWHHKTWADSMLCCVSQHLWTYI